MAQELTDTSDGCKPEPTWVSPDLRDAHTDLSRLRSYRLGNIRWLELMQGALDMLVAADAELASDSRNGIPDALFDPLLYSDKLID